MPDIDATRRVLRRAVGVTKPVRKDPGDMMEFITGYRNHADAVVALFSDAFSASEGPEEGRLIGKLAQDLLSGTAEDDLFVFSSWERDVVTGCIVFSRLTFDQDDRTVFLLAPVAVRTGLQGRKIGQRLLKFGLDALRRKGIDVAITYGDPAFYSKVGFAPITREIARPPLALDHPEGWLAQSLADRPLEPIKGPSRCVDALDNPDYW